MKQFNLNKSDDRKQMIYGDIDLDNIEVKLVIDFIQKSIKHNRNIEDIYDLAICFNLFLDELISYAKTKLENKYVGNIIKLTILDYLLSCSEKMDRSLFDSLNALFINHDDIFLNFQSRLNLSIYDVESFNYFLIQEHYCTESLYYRLINSVKESKQLKDNIKNEIENILNLINDSDVISLNQKKDLIKHLNHL